MKTRLIVLVCWIFLILGSGCAVTQYVKKGVYDRNGYEDRQIEERLYEIKAIGNIHTSKQRALDLFLLRCAELAQQNDYPYFLTSADKIDLDLNDLSSPVKEYAQHKVWSYQFGFEKFEIKGYVLFLTLEEARKAREGMKPIKKVSYVYGKKSYLFKELKKFLEQQEKKETEENDPLSAEKEQEQDLKKIDQELGIDRLEPEQVDGLTNRF